MSTIVIVKKADKIAIAADTMSSFGDTKVTAKYLGDRSKILKCGSTYLGVAGSGAHNNVLTSIISKHGRRLSFKSTKDIFETYLKLHAILKDEYYVNVTEDEHDSYESSQIDALVANPYGIFGIYSWREVYEYERFWALGSGMEYAMGAMHAVYEQLDDAEEIAGVGVTASCEFDTGSALPMKLHSVRMTKTKNR